MDENRTSEDISFAIIGDSGDARSFAFEALQEAKKGDFEKAKILLQKADESSQKAHKTQTDLLFNEVRGDRLDVNVLLVHAQDHLMTSCLAVELIKEIIELYQKK